MTGRIFDIQRFSIHDGPGIRTTVFLKGCPMRCVWCHNPEGLSSERELAFAVDKCIGCGACFRVCRSKAHLRVDGKHLLDRRLCSLCGLCAKECPAKALEMAGRDVTPGEVLDEVLRDKPFYENSGGGMTLSGGEPLMQADFSGVLLREAKGAGIHCAVETCGYAAYGQFERIRPLVDLFLYDIKETDPVRHREITGVSNDRILDNLKRLHDSGVAIRVRLPIVPGQNDSDRHFAALAELGRAMPRLLGFEVMPYHALGKHKLDKLGMKPACGPFRTPTAEMVSGWEKRLRELGLNVTAAA